MLGNVWELCEDSWRDRFTTNRSRWMRSPSIPSIAATARRMRAHIFYYGTGDIRACRRDNMNPKEAEADAGFRVMRELSRRDSKSVPHH